MYPNSRLPAWTVLCILFRCSEPLLSVNGGTLPKSKFLDASQRPTLSVVFLRKAVSPAVLTLFRTEANIKYDLFLMLLFCVLEDQWKNEDVWFLSKVDVCSSEEGVEKEGKSYCRQTLALHSFEHYFIHYWRPSAELSSSLGFSECASKSRSCLAYRVVKRLEELW